MSQESVQFVELIREAAARAAEKYQFYEPSYCEGCGKTGQHGCNVTADGWEIRTCPSCGNQVWYRVK